MPDRLKQHSKRLAAIVDDSEYRSQAQEALRDIEEFGQQIIASVTEGVTVLDANLRYIVWNPFMARLLDLPAEKVLGRHPSELWPETRTNGRLALMERVLAGESINFPDAQPVSGNKRTSWVQSHFSPLRNAEGKIIGIIGILRDISERKKAEEALRLTRVTFERAATGIFWIDSDAQIVDVNDAGCVMLGYTRGELLALSVWDIDTDVTRENWNESWEHLKRSGTLLLEVWNRTRDGRLIPVEIAANFIQFNGRELNCAFIRDISGRRQAEEAVRSSEERYRMILETAEEGIWMVDADLATAFVNPKMAQMLGTSVKEMMWRPILEFIASEDRAKSVELLKRRRQGVREQYEFRFRRMDGEFIWTAVAANPVYDAAGSYIGSLRMISDITERRHTAELLARSHDDLRALAARLESAREEESLRIAREIHDELGQNLTAMKMDVAWLREQFGSMGAPKESEAPMLVRMEALSKLLSSTVTTVRRICSELRPSALDDIGLTAAIESHALQFQARSGIRCTLSLTPELLALDAGRGTAVYRIFQEILTNAARHAEASRMVIELQQCGTDAVLKVADNGKGFSDSEAASCKTLGLLGMRERALAIGGRVEIRSAPHAGTTVTVFIPLDKHGK